MSGVGRPRGFDRDAALKLAMALFWERGYAATSLDELTAAMGIGRSSFYAAFGAKHAVLLEVLDHYTSEMLVEIDAAAKRARSPRQAVLAILEIVACTREPENGCLFVNSVTELLPSDSAVAKLAARHLQRVDLRVTGLLRKLGLDEANARKRSGAMLALATGAVTLRKAGQSLARIRAVLDLSSSLMP